jgi:hypothetical protein
MNMVDTLRFVHPTLHPSTVAGFYPAIWRGYVKSPFFNTLIHQFKNQIATQNNEGNNLLHLAIEQNNLEAIELLLALNTSKNVRKKLIFSLNQLDLTPLALAACLGHMQTVDCLLNEYQKYQGQFDYQIIDAVELVEFSLYPINDTGPFAMILKKIIEKLKDHPKNLISESCFHTPQAFF